MGLSLVLAGSVTVPDPGAEPEPIVGGLDADTCEFPAAVAMLNGGGNQFCTGALVHPRVVMLAAHCVASQIPANVGFGESIFSPAVSVPVAECGSHPEFEYLDHFLPMDLAFCTLAADAPPVPIVPPLMGCEAEQLTPDAEITLVGFGIDDEGGGSGNTTKRWTVNTVQTVDEDANDLILLGVEGASACFGDSGGPAYMQLADGSWRLVGITSESHPDVHDEPQVCGYGVIYELVHLQMSWFEEAAGFDVTPCFDADGTWNASEDCGGFPTSLGSGQGWKAACGLDEVSGPSETCGAAFGEGGSSSGGEVDTDTSDSDTVGDSTGMVSGGTAGPGSTSAAGDDSTSTSAGASASGPDPEAGSTGGAGAFETAAESSGGDGAGGGDGDGGCGCRSSDDGAPWLLLLAVGWLRRRC